MTEYTADNIRILSESEVESKFEWAKIGKLASQYKRDQVWIERGFRACQQVGCDPDYFINRYLRNDRAIPVNKEVDECFRDMFVRKSLRNE